MKTELFKFIEEGTTWTITPIAVPVEYDSEIYLPAVIKRNEIESKNELNKAALEVTLDMDNAMARRWLIDRVEAVVTVTVFEIDEEDEVSVAWKGRLCAVKPGDSDITLVFESIFTSLRRPGLRARYLRSCRYSLYGRGCGLNKEGFAIAGVASAASSLTITVTAAAGYPDGWFQTGIIKFDGIQRFITSHIGSSITVIRPIESLIQSVADDGPQAVVLYPGCDRSRATCNSKFSNLLNYGGFDWIPVRNPIDGSSIV